jgi:hypothetical protein
MKSEKKSDLKFSSEVKGKVIKSFLLFRDEPEN